MENQVGSINFDANHLYLEEDESEGEYDDKRQDNEIRDLISQGGLDGFLDDDSLMNSSAESSYEQSDSENQNEQHKAQQREFNNVPAQANANMLPAPQAGFVLPPQVINNENIHATPAHINQMKSHLNKNYLINEFNNPHSTPANNQNPPPPQLLQATVIPKVAEEKLFYRQQRNPNQQSPSTSLETQQAQVQFQTPCVVQNQENEETMMLKNDQIEYNNVVDMTVAHLVDDEMNKQNFLHLQEQHYIGHSKLHSMNRFNVPAPLPLVQPHVNDVHNHLSSEHELNETDSEEENNIKLGNGVGINLGKSIEQQQQQQQQTIADNQQLIKYKEQSLIDLNELDEAQLKQLQAEEEKQQEEYFNIDSLNRMYCQAQFLYKVRGKKLEEVTNRFTAYQEDMSREMRAMKHRLSLAEKEKESLQISLDQAHDLCTQYKAETDLSKKSCMEVQEKIEQLKQTNRILEQKLLDNEQEIENLHLQINEQQKLDTLERVQQQHEHYIQQLREQYESDLFQFKEKYGESQRELNDKHELIALLKVQLETASKNAETAIIERADTINRLTKSLNDLQVKYDQDILLVRSQSAKTTQIDHEKLKLIDELNAKCQMLEEQLKLQTINASNNSDFHLSSLTNSLNNTSHNPSEVTNTLQRELERALNTLKQKRSEIQTYQNEIEQLKRDMNALRSNKSNDDAASNGASINANNANLEEINRLNSLLDELQRERVDLNNDMMEKNKKIDELLEQEEQFQQLKQNFEIELFNKQQHIQECEHLIQQLSQNQDNQLMIGQYESQMAELQLKLTNKEHEIQKVREMYIEVCKDKNNLQDTLKEQYDSEYELKLKHQLNMAMADKLDEQKNSLMEKWSKEKSALSDDYKRKLDTSLLELKSLKEQLIQLELQCNNLKVEKANLEAKSVRAESELKEKCLNLEVLLKENEEKARTERKQTDNELNEARKQIEQLRIELESSTNESQSNMSDLRQQLEEKVDQFRRQNEQYSNKINELNALIQTEHAGKLEYEKQIDSLRSQLSEKDSNQNNAFQIELSQAQVSLEQCANELQLTKEKLDQTENLLKKNEEELVESRVKFESQLSAMQTNKQDEIDNLRKQTQLEASQLKEKLKTLQNESERLSQVNKQLSRQLVEQSEKLEMSMRNWHHEKSSILNSKEDELQKMIVELEKRFEDDYGKFMDTHKEAMQRTLNEKSVEFSKEKEKLIEIYQAKYNEYEANEQSLLKQIKELREKVTINSPSRPLTNSFACQTDGDNTYVDELLTRINELEQMLTNTDAHFELELNKLRQELEDEYQIKLKSELENDELTRKQLEEEIDNLKYLLDKKYAQDSYENEMSMKNAFESKELQLEQEFRVRIEQIECDFEEHLRKLKVRHEDELLKQKQELNDGYKQALSKSKSDIEQAQLLIKRLKKSNQDSDKVIESLKVELSKVKENHLNELTTLKMSTEREKEQLKENYEKAMSKVALLEKQLDEGEERMKKQCDLLREELKAEYGSELTRMNTKMKDMAKAHTNAIDALKKHHQYNSRLSSASSQTELSHASACQTDLTYKDVELLEAFRQKYLNTLTQLKSDLIREFDAQTMRVSQTYTRQLKEERSIIKEKLFAILLPKVAMVLREFRVLESVIACKLSEFEKDVANIVSSMSTATTTESGSSAPSPSSSSSSSANRTPSSASSSSAIAAAAVAKRSLSALSSTNKQDSLIERLKTTSNLYSKSVSSMRNINGSNTSLTSNSDNKANSEMDLKESDVHNNANNSNNNNYTRQLNVSTGGYKYTPLRQSWSNLSQMNQLSPYSSSSSNHENAKKTLFDEKSDKSSDNSMPSRPMTADSISSRGNFASKLKTQPAHQDEFIDEKEEDYVYFDDEKEAIDSVDFNKRYRTQNIRHKRTSRTAQLLKDNEKMYERPRSAHNLIVESINTTNQTKLTRSSTNLHSDSITALSSSTTTKRNLDDILQPKTTLSIYSNKTGRMLADSSVNSDQTDHTPIRLSSENVHQNPSTRLLTNATMKTATTVTSNPVSTSSAVTAFTSSSLPRSRTPTNTNGANNNHYKSATISSVNKSVHPTQNESGTTTPINLISISNNSIQHQSSLSNASTQYHAISSSIASSLVKNSAFQKKKPVFY